jgi:hypothetical protein
LGNNFGKFSETILKIILKNNGFRGQFYNQFRGGVFSSNFRVCKIGKQPCGVTFDINFGEGLWGTGLWSIFGEREQLCAAASSKSFKKFQPWGAALTTSFRTQLWGAAVGSNFGSSFWEPLWRGSALGNTFET